MNPAATKALIDIEKRTFDQSFETVCLEENRSQENIDQYNKTVDALIRLLRQSKEEVRASKMVVQ